MKKNVLITGSSTGIGLETALYFQEKGWNVAATMRHPEQRETALHSKDDILKLHLDVLDKNSIHAALRAALDKFGRIDALVNNAGYGLVGPFEAATEEQIRRQFDTNLFGLMAVIRALLPHFREQGGGTIINVASIGGRVTFPFYSLYHGTKWAVEGFSESLQHELRPFNIRVKIVEPGPIKTDFYERSADLIQNEGFTVYDEQFHRALPNMMNVSKLGARPRKVAKTIYRAANGKFRKLRYPVHALGMLAMRRLLPDRLFDGMVRLAVMR